MQTPASAPIPTAGPSSRVTGALAVVRSAPAASAHPAPTAYRCKAAQAAVTAPAVTGPDDERPLRRVRRGPLTAMADGDGEGLGSGGVCAKPYWPTVPLGASASASTTAIRAAAGSLLSKSTVDTFGEGRVGARRRQRTSADAGDRIRATDHRPARLPAEVGGEPSSTVF